MTMTREQIIQQLIEKEIWWLGTDLKNSNYNNLETNPYVPRFKIDRTDDGYFYTSDSLVSYCDLKTGEIFRIRRYWENKDWNCYNQLYQKGLELGFRIDIPLYKDTVEVNGEQWEYAEFRSPGNDYGKNYNDDVFLWPELTNGVVPNSVIDQAFRETVKNYYIEFVDQVAVIIKESKNIAIDNMCGLPLGLSYIFNRYRDDQGYFWSDFDHFTWTRTGSDVLNDSMLYLKGTLTFGVVCGVITEEQGVEVTNYAREEWAQI
jgi:hypothetical protein